MHPFQSVSIRFNPLQEELCPKLKPASRYQVKQKTCLLTLKDTTSSACGWLTRLHLPWWSQCMCVTLTAQNGIHISFQPWSGEAQRTLSAPSISLNCKPGLIPMKHSRPENTSLGLLRTSDELWLLAAMLVQDTFSCSKITFKAAIYHIFNFKNSFTLKHVCQNHSGITVGARIHNWFFDALQAKKRQHSVAPLDKKRNSIIQPLPVNTEHPYSPIVFSCSSTIGDRARGGNPIAPAPALLTLKPLYGSVGRGAKVMLRDLKRPIQNAPTAFAAAFAVFLCITDTLRGCMANSAGWRKIAIDGLLCRVSTPLRHLCFMNLKHSWS